MVLVTCKNPRSLRHSDQTSLTQDNSYIERSYDKLFLLSTCLQGQIGINGTFCMRIKTSKTQLTQGTKVCIISDGTSDNMIVF